MPVVPVLNTGSSADVWSDIQFILSIVISVGEQDSVLSIVRRSVGGHAVCSVHHQNRPFATEPQP